LPDFRVIGAAFFYRHVQEKGRWMGSLIEELKRPAGRPAGEPRPASPIGAVTVLPWQEGADASVLPQAYQDLLEVAAGAGRPLRAGEFAAAAGLPAEKAKVEGLRSKLRLLAPAPGGLFTLSDHSEKTPKPGQ
jgi:hypothetical protein